MAAAESRRRSVPRRLRQAGIPRTSMRTSVPQDRRAWQWLLADPVADTPAPAPASRDEALSLPAFGRGVEILASTFADVPLDAYRWDPARGVDMKLADQPSVLTDPYPMQDAWQWRYSVGKDLVEAGNHLALLGDLDWRTGRAGWVVPLPVAHCGLVEDPSQPGWYLWSVAGVLLDPSSVLHISAGNRSGEILGQGVISQYAGHLGGQLAAEEWAARYVAAGGLPPAIIQHPSIQPGEQDKAETFKAVWRRVTRTGEAAVLPMGSVVTPLQTDAEKQQLVEARTWNAELSAMMLGIPAHKLNLDGPTMTYQNVESADVAFVRDVVTRWSNPVAYALTKWLMPAGTTVKPRWSARSRTDLPTQTELVVSQYTAGLIERDEARQALGYEPLAVPADTQTQAGSTPEGVPNLGPVGMEAAA